MYIYFIYDNDARITLTHKDKFTQDEFVKICNKIPMINYGMAYLSYRDIIVYLNNFGFKEITSAATFHIGRSY